MKSFISFSKTRVLFPFVFLATVLMVGYTNCSKGFSPLELELASQDSGLQDGLFGERNAFESTETISAEDFKSLQSEFANTQPVDLPDYDPVTATLVLTLNNNPEGLNKTSLPDYSPSLVVKIGDQVQGVIAVENGVAPFKISFIKDNVVRRIEYTKSRQAQIDFPRIENAEDLELFTGRFSIRVSDISNSEFSSEPVAAVDKELDPEVEPCDNGAVNPPTCTCSSGQAVNPTTGLCAPVICNPTLDPTTQGCQQPANSVATRTCTAGGFAYSSCSVTRCNAGYGLINGSCSATPCANGATNAPACTCSSGQSVNPATGLCTPVVCTPSPTPTAQGCQQPANSVATRTCLAGGFAYSTCSVTSCNSGYRLLNGTCSAIPCTNGATNAPTCTCSSGQSVDPTTGLCTPVVCTPSPTPMAQGCQQPANSVATRTCLAGGFAYSTCSVTSCNSGYRLLNGSCSAIPCTNGATNAPTCTCSSGQAVNPTTGQCAETCIPSRYTSVGCPVVDNGSTTRSCMQDGFTYTACTTTCNTGYILVNGSCNLNNCTNGGTNPPTCTPPTLPNVVFTSQPTGVPVANGASAPISFNFQSESNTTYVIKWYYAPNFTEVPVLYSNQSSRSISIINDNGNIYSFHFFATVTATNSVGSRTFTTAKAYFYTASEEPCLTNAAPNAGTTDLSCLSNTGFDACIFYKNPVVANCNPIYPYLRYGSDLDRIQTYGVRLQNRISNQSLRSNSISVIATSGTPVQFNAQGQARASYKTDQNKSWISQLMAYFWLTYQESEFLRPERANGFYAKNKNITVDAIKKGTAAEGLVNNAFFNGNTNSIVMGQIVFPNEVKQEMGLSGEVYVHEMGHANLHHAAPNAVSIASPEVQRYFIRLTDNTIDDDYWLCKTKLGCVEAINEGQADFHTYMIFPNSSSILNMYNNTLDGLPERNTRLLNQLNANRAFAEYEYAFDVTGNFSTFEKETYPSGSGTVRQIIFRASSGQQIFKYNMGGEVHDMGALYAKLLYDIYTDQQMSKPDFEKMFSVHLSLMTNRSRFPEARDALIASMDAIGSITSQKKAAYAALIRNKFSSRGIQ